MQNVKLVDARNLETIEQYGAALLASMRSLEAIKGFHMVALKIGILDDKEIMEANNILAQIDHLWILYRKQVENVVERTNLNEDAAIKELERLYPDIKIPRKKKNLKEKKNAKATPTNAE